MTISISKRITSGVNMSMPICPVKTCRSICEMFFAMRSGCSPKMFCKSSGVIFVRSVCDSKVFALKPRTREDSYDGVRR